MSPEPRCDLIVTLQARGLEADSELLRVRLRWTGGWSDNIEKMKDFMKVEEVSESDQRHLIDARSSTMISE